MPPLALAHLPLPPPPRPVCACRLALAPKADLPAAGLWSGGVKPATCFSAIPAQGQASQPLDASAPLGKAPDAGQVNAPAPTNAAPFKPAPAPFTFGACPPPGQGAVQQEGTHAAVARGEVRACRPGSVVALRPPPSGAAGRLSPRSRLSSQGQGKSEQPLPAFSFGAQAPKPELAFGSGDAKAAPPFLFGATATAAPAAAATKPSAVPPFGARAGGLFLGAATTTNAAAPAEDKANEGVAPSKGATEPATTARTVFGTAEHAPALPTPAFTFGYGRRFPHVLAERQLTAAACPRAAPWAPPSSLIGPSPSLAPPMRGRSARRTRPCPSQSMHTRGRARNTPEMAWAHPAPAAVCVRPRRAPPGLRQSWRLLHPLDPQCSPSVQGADSRRLNRRSRNQWELERRAPHPPSPLEPPPRRRPPRVSALFPPFQGRRRAPRQRRRHPRLCSPSARPRRTRPQPLGPPRSPVR